MLGSALFTEEAAWHPLYQGAVSSSGAQSHRIQSKPEAGSERYKEHAPVLQYYPRARIEHRPLGNQVCHPGDKIWPCGCGGNGARQNAGWDRPTAHAAAASLLQPQAQASGDRDKMSGPRSLLENMSSSQHTLGGKMAKDRWKTRATERLRDVLPQKGDALGSFLTSALVFTVYILHN